MGGIDRRPRHRPGRRTPTTSPGSSTLARETGLPLAVRSGGHSGAGHSVVDDGIVLDLRDLNELDIDVDGRTAWAGAGLTAAEYTTAAAEHGLATGFGDTGSVGLGGITLGGGIGYLVRKHGLTIDSLLAADLVTADGELIRVDAEHHPDLFWAIRGGGGNFGVATRFKYRLHPVESTVGGMLILPATADTDRRVHRGRRRGAGRALDDRQRHALPADAVRARGAARKARDLRPHGLRRRHRGRRTSRRAVPSAGDAARRPGARAAVPGRCIRRRTTSYHPLAVSRTMFIDRIDRAVAATMIERLEASDAAMRVAQLRVLGGAMARVPDDATAFAHRTARSWSTSRPSTRDPTTSRCARRGSPSSRRPCTRATGGVRQLPRRRGRERVRAAYPGTTWDRLATIKARYDPDNLFRLNQNIPPATGAEGSTPA